MSEFEIRLRGWLENQGFDCDVVFDDDFGYDWAENELHVGDTEYPEVIRWYEQFMFEFGLEWAGIPGPVLMMLHELGHYMTLDSFTDSEKCLLQVYKMLNTEDRMEDMGAMFDYWEASDEFAANMWALDYINWNIGAVEELANIYFESWDA